MRDGTAGDGQSTNHGTELGRLVRSRRERIDPASIPGLARAGHHKSGVSQEDMARLIGVSNVWYGRLERGESANYSAEMLDRTAAALRLSDEERMMLYLHALGHEPPPRATRARVQLTEPLQRIVNAQPWPAYLSDESWDVVVYNKQMLEWFPWIGAGVENNVMRWVCTDPQARQQLCRWETDWAPLMLAQLRIAMAKQPGNTRLYHLVREILQASPDARRLWERDSLVYVHPDGHHRKVYVPFQREAIEIELTAFAPLRSADARLMMLLPLDGGHRLGPQR
jgi:transcriptional regulator with XRE-family HTH domain